MIFVRRVLLVIVAAFLAWRILSYGIAEHYLDQADGGDASAVDRALAWNARQPDALYRRAQAIREEDPAGSSSLFRRAFVENPSSSYPLMALAEAAQSAGEENQARVLVDMSSKLMPANPRIQIAVGGYWARRGSLETALVHWSQALEASLDVSDELFPILLKLAEDPRTVGLLRPVAASPPSWWERFFSEAAKRALDLRTVRSLYAFRRAAETAPLTRNERDFYVRRLKREGKITEAYLVWVNGLDETEQAHLGILNNGGFEIEPTNTGFDWHLRAADRVVANTGTTGGIEGEKALHLIFRGREKRYLHVRQPLFLDAAAYEVRGMARTDGLDSKGGLKWIVRCLFPETVTLGESERFLGSSQWRAFSFAVRVPEGCEAQEILLISAGQREFEYKMTGGIWFDSMSMRKVDPSVVSFGPTISNDTAPGTVPGATTDGNSDPLQVTGGRVFSLGPSLIERLGSSED